MGPESNGFRQSPLQPSHEPCQGTTFSRAIKAQIEGGFSPCGREPYRASTLFKITRARFTLSATAHVSLGLDPPISSRASRTAAMIDAQIATVLAYRLLCSFSQAICRFISPIPIA
jgi:hypothetical protein